MDRKVEAAGGSATLGMCRGRNSTKSDNVMGSSLLERLLLRTSEAAAVIVGIIRLLYGKKKMDRVEAPVLACISRWSVKYSLISAYLPV